MRKKMTKRRCEFTEAAGFTLLELLVVIVIVGVISAIAAPSWLSFLTQRRMDRASTDLAGLLRTTQEEAQRKQIDKQISFSSTDLAVTVRNNSATSGGETTALGEGELNDNFNLQASTPVVFDHDGKVEADTIPYVIKITNDNSSSQSCVIITTLLGGVKQTNGDECDTFANSPF